MDSLPSTQLMNIRNLGVWPILTHDSEVLGYFSLISQMRIWTCVCVSILLNRNRLAVCYFEYRYTNDILNDTTVPIEPLSRISIWHIVNDETRYTDSDAYGPPESSKMKPQKK